MEETLSQMSCFFSESTFHANFRDLPQIKTLIIMSLLFDYLYRCILLSEHDFDHSVHIPVCDYHQSLLQRRQ